MKLRILSVFVGLLILAIGAFGGLALAQSSACFNQQGGAKRVAASGCEYEFRSGSTLDVQSGTTLDLNGTFSFDDVTTEGDSVISPQTAISVTNGSVVTPTGTYQQLESAGAVTATLSSGCTAGQGLELVNTVAQAIVISETATSALAGNVTLNQYDTLTARCDGTRWVERARSNN